MTQYSMLVFTGQSLQSSVRSRWISKKSIIYQFLIQYEIILSYCEVYCQFIKYLHIEYLSEMILAKRE